MSDESARIRELEAQLGALRQQNAAQAAELNSLRHEKVEYQKQQGADSKEMHGASSAKVEPDVDIKAKVESPSSLDKKDENVTPSKPLKSKVSTESDIDILIPTLNNELPMASSSKKIDRDSALTPKKELSSPRMEKTPFIPPMGVLRHYLDNTEKLIVSPPPDHHGTARLALMKTFGFHSVHLYDKERLAIFPKRDRNPYAPAAPCEPGLMLCSREDVWNLGPWKLYVDFKGPDKKVLWRYMGEYKCSSLGNLTAQEFQALPVSVKKGWVSNIATKATVTEYVEMRERITSHHPGNLKGDQLVAVILSAFEEGEERMGVVKMECVSYNHAHAHESSNAQDAYLCIETKPKLSKSSKKRSVSPEPALRHPPPSKKLKVEAVGSPSSKSETTDSSRRSQRKGKKSAKAFAA